MSDRFDELLDPGKAKGLRKELARLYPPRGTRIVPPGVIYVCAEPEYIGRMPVRVDIKVVSVPKESFFDRLRRFIFRRPRS